MNSGLVMDEIEGIATKEPAFGLDATWVTPDRKEDAIIKGYTVVDPATVITTHLSELVKKHAEEMLTRQDVQKLVDSLKKEYPAVAEDALRAASVGVIQRILKDLLHEKVPIRDMLTIMETIADVAEVTKSPDILLEQVRSRLARTITGLYKNDQGMIRLLTIDTANEQQMLDKVKEQNGQRNFLLSVKEIGSLVEATGAKAKEVLERGVAPVVIIVDPMLRKPLSDIYERFGLDVVVLSHAEIDPSARFEVLGSIVINDW
jgi:flagellar biosynthesis protein FlhA